MGAELPGTQGDSLSWPGEVGCGRGMCELPPGEMVVKEGLAIEEMGLLQETQTSRAERLPVGMDGWMTYFQSENVLSMGIQTGLSALHKCIVETMRMCQFLSGSGFLGTLVILGGCAAADCVPACLFVDVVCVCVRARG